MCAMSADLVNSALATIEVLPGTANLLNAGSIKDLRIDGDEIYLKVSLGLPGGGRRALLTSQIETVLKEAGASSVELNLNADIASNGG